MKGVMRTKVYKFYSDPGHAWMAVKRRELEILQIADKISSCSYQKGATVYLEEDCDAVLFCRAYKEMFGHEPRLKEKHKPRCMIRTYDAYSNVNETYEEARQWQDGR